MAKWLFSLVVVLGTLSPTFALSQAETKRVVVPTILDISYGVEESDPPRLVIRATGQVPTLGYADVRLERIAYRALPEDGIQEFRLTAVPPTGPAGQQITQVLATYVWDNVDNDEFWLKGIRVGGIGKGVKEVRFDEEGDTPEADERRFSGESARGNFQEALDAALSQLDKAMSEQGVADGMASWKIVEVSGDRGGIAGQRNVKVTISATRSPGWQPE
jgi:hypothetical protein